MNERLKYTPKKICFDSSNPAAYIRAVYGGSRSITIRHENLEIVLCLLLLSSNGTTVSKTIKSIEDSDDRPI